MAINTLLIAAGGTGTTSVRNVFSAWNRAGIEAPPNVAVAVIDAHATVEPPKPGFYGLGNNPSYSGSQMVEPSVQWGHVKDKIANWKPDMVNAAPEAPFSNGCGAIRFNGRYWLAIQGARAQRAIARAIESVQSYGQAGSGPASGQMNWQVYICASLGNGTGAGIFMGLGAIAKDVLFRRFDAVTPQVWGVFVPGTVTKHGNKTQTKARVMSAGIASLVELQYEFNRDGAEDRFGDGSSKSTVAQAIGRPDDPYAIDIRDIETQEWQTFRPYHDDVARDDRWTGRPIDYGMILDVKNRNSIQYNYKALCESGGTALAAMIMGADAGNRLLDTRLHRQECRFGSFSSLSFMVPSGSLQKSFAAENLADAYASMVSDSVDPSDPIHRKLLSISPGSLGGDDRQTLTTTDIEKLKPKEAVRTSVDTFIDHVIDAKEKDGKNDLFDRLKDDTRTFQENFRRKLKGALESESTGDKQEQLEIALGSLKRTIETAWPNKVEEALKMHLDRHPEDDVLDDLNVLDNPFAGATPQNAGARYLVDVKISQFVTHGQFGLAIAWLEELLSQLNASKNSIFGEEFTGDVAKLKAQQNAKVGEVKRLQAMLGQATEGSEGMFGFLKKSQTLDKLGDVGRELDVAF